MTSATVSQKTGMALDDWMASENIELWDGEVIEMSPQAIQSSEIALTLAFQIKLYLQTHPVGQVFMEGAFYVPPSDERNWVSNAFTPDVMLLSASQIEALNEDQPDWKKKGAPTVPVLAVEIMSPSDRMPDALRKAETYLRLGVGVVWIIEPETQQVLIYDAAQGNTILTAKDTLQAEALLPGFALPLAELLPTDKA